MIRYHFSTKTEYGHNKWLFEDRKEKLNVLREAYKEYAMISGLPKYKGGDIMIIPYENLQGTDAEGCLFGKVDYSKTTYSIEVKAMIWVNNDKEADYWKERFEQVSSRYNRPV